MAGKMLSKDDTDFLAECEEEFKDRFTEKDEEFMKVYNSEPSKPPIVENWFHSGSRNDRRGIKRSYGSHQNRDRGRQHFQDRRHNYESRGYNDYQGFDDNRSKQRRYN